MSAWILLAAGPAAGVLCGKEQAKEHAMTQMHIGPAPSGLKVIDVTYEGPPTDELQTNERIYPGDFIKNVDGVARRSNFGEATHIAFQAAEKGTSVICERFDRSQFSGEFPV